MRSLRTLLGLHILFLVMAFSGCGPVYETNYSYVPPSDMSAQTCIFQCQNMKMQCEQLEQMQASRCEDRGERERERCEREIRRKGKEPKWYECGSTTCSVDYERCEMNYRSCYVACGGQVNAEQVCVFNCK